MVADRRSLLLNGTVGEVDADGDGWGRGEGDCNDRAIGDDPGDGLPGPASINPGMADNQVLMGMNVLKHLEFTQRGDTLVLRASGK